MALTQAAMRSRTWQWAITVFLVIIVIGMVLPSALTIPVIGTTAKDWNPKSFWYEPWGASGVHKGIDIFAPKGSKVVATAPGIVLFAGEIDRGGTVALVLGAKWRVHYYAHLDSLTTRSGSWVGRDQQVGTVGTTGNAAGKPPHLHFSVVTLIPYPWLFTTRTQGWKKMFYLDPGRLIVG
jgi:murein DD-endopeptidase MepM/ murein hydrolase activator NlpD